MGGGQKRKSSSNVVLQVPKLKHKNGSMLGGEVGGAGVEESEGRNPCKTFILDNPKVAMQKLQVETLVYAEKDGSGLLVKTNGIGVIGSVPSRIAAMMFREGRDLRWSGEVVEIDKDRLSIKVKLCPMQ